MDKYNRLLKILRLYLLSRGLVEDYGNFVLEYLEGENKE